MRTAAVLSACVCLSTVLLSSISLSAAPRKEFPSRHGMVNVTTFGANGSDQTSDRTAVLSAIGSAGNYPNPKIVYFPAGTYVMDGDVNMYGTSSCTVDQCGCCVTFQGQGPEYTVIKLKENTTGFTSASSPKAFIFSPSGNMSFKYNLYDVKIEIGNGNNGAMALDWITNNQGALENVVIVSNDGNAFVGLEMTRQWPGPCLAKNVTIDGFQYGIRVGNDRYAPTFNNITLRNQKLYGWRNDGNVVNIAGLTSINTVPAFSQGSGVTVLVDAVLNTPQGQTSTSGAIECNGFVYARNVTTSGYATALKKGGVSVGQTSLTEYCTQSTQFTLFTNSGGTPKLECKNAPDFWETDTAKWVCALDHQISVSGTSYPGLQASLDFAAANGKTSVYYPQKGQVPYPIHNGPITIPTQVRYITGFDSKMKPPGTEKTHLDVVGAGEPLIIEGLSFSGVTLHLQGTRTVVIKHCEIDSVINSPGAGELHIEDMSPIVYLQNPQHVYLKQFNPERMLVSGVDAWKKLRLEAWGCQVSVLGLKSEGAGTLLTGRQGATIDLLGAYALPVDAFNSSMAAAPAFICDESCMSLIYVLAGGYSIDVREIRGGVTKDLLRSQVSSVPYFLANKGCPDQTPVVQPQPSAEVPAVKMRTAPRTALNCLHRALLPAQANRLIVFTLQGRKAWEYRRAAPGNVEVTIPRDVAAQGISVVKTGN